MIFFRVVNLFVTRFLLRKQSLALSSSRTTVAPIFFEEEFNALKNHWQKEEQLYLAPIPTNPGVRKN
jgi:hypothetical protein